MGLFTQDAGRDLTPGGEVLGEGDELDQPTDPLYTPPGEGST